MKRKMYLFLVENSKHKKSKGMNRNVATAISHNESKDVLLNNICIRKTVNGENSK